MAARVYGGTHSLNHSDDDMTWGRWNTVMVRELPMRVLKRGSNPGVFEKVFAGAALTEVSGEVLYRRRRNHP